MKGRTDISLVLPCYNEEKLFRDSVGRIIETLDRLPYRWEILFVDDGSHDNTPALIRAVCTKDRRCRAIYHPFNVGRGKTVADGIIAARGRVAGYIDIDLEVSPIYIAEMVAPILAGKTDSTVGKRIYRTAVPSLFREILSRGYRRLADLVIATGGIDTESGYKFFNRKKIVPILSLAAHPHWFWDTEIIVYALRNRLRITEIPVLFSRRTDKQSSVRLLPDLLDYGKSLWMFRRKLAKSRT
ncbi:glycosyltransferase family 2 protein [Patescibacteria group bacterium]|nr:glycosyltransferase family 2 protein [Patescibacteria group bacterium]